MALRMLLVILVAGLGLELPSRGEGNAGARRCKTRRHHARVEVPSRGEEDGRERGCARRRHHARLGEASRRPEDMEARVKVEGRSAVPDDRASVSDQAFAAVVEEMVSAFGVEPGQGVGAVTKVDAAASTSAGAGEGVAPGLTSESDRAAEGLSGSIVPTTGDEVAAVVEEMGMMPPGPGDEPATRLGPEATRPIAPVAEKAEEMISPWLLDDLALMPPAPEAETPEPYAGIPSISRGERLVQAIQLTGAAVHAWVTFLQQPPAVVSGRP